MGSDNIKKGKQYVTPSIPQGMVELLPKEQILFNKMMNTIKSNYELFGFIPVDTPVIEKSEVLLAKSGGDTEKQVYRFQKGDNDLALRFDLTVPLARFVAQHYGELTFPFRRYHIGRAYRGERPQRGRFREFYQCDIDIIGNEKLDIIYDAEIPSIIYKTFKDLGFDKFTIRYNNRKILNGIYEHIGITNVETKIEVMRIVDKIDKLGPEAVIDLLKGLCDDKTAKLLIEIISFMGSNEEIITNLETMKIENNIFQEGIREISEVTKNIRTFGVPDGNYAIDLKIARGLDYYTGTVYETTLNDYPEIGSVCSGGRYDNLAQNYTDKQLPGVGISIGLSRLFYQLTTGNIIDTDGAATTSQLLIIPMDDGLAYALETATQMRTEGIRTEVYAGEGKVSKKMTYANKLGIPYVIVIGENEKTNKRFNLKNMSTGVQFDSDVSEAVKLLKATEDKNG